MTYLNKRGLSDLWQRISSIFARKSESGGGLSSSGATIYLISVNGGTLDSVDLSSAIASAVSSGTTGLITQDSADARYGGSLYLNGKKLSLMSRSGLAISTVDLP